MTSAVGVNIYVKHADQNFSDCPNEIAIVSVVGKLRERIVWGRVTCSAVI